MKLEEFTDFADRIINKEVPPVLVRDLNLGIIVLPEEYDDGEFYILGEYITEELGSYIALYYGSFVKALGGESREVWKREIRDTIKHELRHHLEALAGDEKLAREEMKELQERLERPKEKNAPLSGAAERLLNLLMRIKKGRRDK